VKTLGLKIGKKVALGGSKQAELAANIFNLLNAGDFTQYNYNGANEVSNTANYLQMRNQQPARALQLTMVYRFRSYGGVRPHEIDAPPSSRGFIPGGPCCS